MSRPTQLDVWNYVRPLGTVTRCQVIGHFGIEDRLDRMAVLKFLRRLVHAGYLVVRQKTADDAVYEVARQ